MNHVLNFRSNGDVMLINHIDPEYLIGRIDDDGDWMPDDDCPDHWTVGTVRADLLRQMDEPDQYFQFPPEMVNFANR